MKDLLTFLCLLCFCIANVLSLESAKKPDFNGGNKSLIDILFVDIKRSKIPSGDVLIILGLLFIIIIILERCCRLHNTWCYSHEFKDKFCKKEKELYSSIPIESSTDAMTTDVDAVE
mmetsp:Transcript_95342/g.116752  ORF Transcript_95342/g.116752 Transcript_95342/m.116752 type:complete len:117 (-) Transcript_95342:113-463(-)